MTMTDARALKSRTLYVSLVIGVATWSVVEA